MRADTYMKRAGEKYSVAQFICAGSSDRQSAEKYVKEHGGKVIQLAATYKVMDDDYCEYYCGGFAVVLRKPKYKTLVVPKSSYYGETEDRIEF